MTNTAQLLHNATRGVVVAPAGYGKTHLIAEAVNVYGSNRELILTHTHAGVDSIKRKLIKLNTSNRKNFQVETIDGFILRYVSHYPKSCNWQGSLENIDWNNTRTCGINLFKSESIKNILKASYTGLYVDEYQDCCKEQHSIVLEISSVLPTRILGDPMQGIFNFRNIQIVDWDSDVQSNYQQIAVLDTPWRWNNAKNPELGNWLALQRDNIKSSRAITKNSLPSCIKWVKCNTEQDIIKECYSVISSISANETLIVIGIADRVATTHNLASKLRGICGIVEPLESRDLKEAINKLTDNCVFNKATGVLDIAVLCLSGINNTNLKTEYNSLKSKKLPKKKVKTVINDPLEEFVNTGDLNKMIVLMESFKNFPNSHLYRKELYYEILKITKESLRAGIPLKDALIRVRENTRRIGRKIPKRAVARTLLVKGLEFDHAIVVSADMYDAKNLYVALTRATKTLTIIASSDSLLSNNNICKS